MTAIRTLDVPIAIVGAGIAGLALGLGLHARGLQACIYEVAPEVKPLGVGITMLPHAMRELSTLGLAEKVAAAGVENIESAFFNRFGQLLYKEPRGRSAGYPVPEVGIHRGALHRILFDAAVAALGTENIVLNRRCVGLNQDESAVSLRFQETTTGKTLPEVRAGLVLAADGVNSAVRRHFYPDEELAFEGINTWRGVARGKPILGGHTYIRIGSIRTGNFTSEVPLLGRPRNDWNKPARLEDVLRLYRGWQFDWLDLPGLLEASELVLEYPMVDRDPVERWTFGRVTLLGDAAHPMYPRGSNGAAQALIDARTLADLLSETKDPRRALIAYERERLPRTTKIVLTNRSTPPDFINIKVEELTGDRPFDNLDRYISQAELRALAANYERIAGFGLEDVRG